MRQTIDAEQNVRLYFFVCTFHVHGQTKAGHRRARQLNAHYLPAGVEIRGAVISHGEKVCCDLGVKKVGRPGRVSRQ